MIKKYYNKYYNIYNRIVPNCEYCNNYINYNKCVSFCNNKCDCPKNIIVYKCRCNINFDKLPLKEIYSSYGGISTIQRFRDCLNFSEIDAPKCYER